MSPFGAQVEPRWILAFDQGYLLRPAPVLELLLATDGVADAVELLAVHKHRDVVFPGEAVRLFHSVFEHAAFQVVGDADVQRARHIGHDVDKERPAHDNPP